jgi:hypothetical protein
MRSPGAWPGVVNVVVRVWLEVVDLADEVDEEDAVDVVDPRRVNTRVCCAHDVESATGEAPGMAGA